MTKGKLDFETRAIHAGIGEAGDYRPTAPAIYPSTTYVYEDVSQIHASLDPMGTGFVYSRNANPTVRALEKALASLEETEEALAFASGMAAIHAAILGTGIKPGQAILAAKQLYGGSKSLLNSFFRDLGFGIDLVDTTDVDKVEAHLAVGDAGVLLFEPVSNPLLTVADVPALIEVAHRHSVSVVVDNTFASPYLLRPAGLGADFVVESATKYLGGHGDVMAGIVACNRENATGIKNLRTATGGILGPFEAWLVLRGIRTLALRVPRHCSNALALATWLSTRPEVLRVHYPGLSEDPGYAIANRLFPVGLAGGMLSFETDLDIAGVDTFLAALKLAVLGPSLGDVETLVLHPAQSSHRALTREERAELGIADGLLRVSVGLESPNDIIADFDRAFHIVFRGGR